MGATLEQLDLSLEQDYKLPGRAHEVLVLNRPDVIEHVHEGFVEAGADALQTGTFQASRLKLDEWGLGDETVEINRRAAEIARKVAGEKRFVAGSIGPTGYLPASDDPTLGNISFRTLADTFAEQAAGLIEGGVDVILIETAQDILEVKAAIFGAREAMKTVGREVPIETHVSLLPNGGKMLLGHRHLRRADDARGARRRRDRAELLDRPGGHARRDPLPRRVLAGAGRLRAERRDPDPGPGRRDDLPRGPRRVRQDAAGLRRALRREHRRRLLRHDARPHPRARRGPEGPPREGAPGAAPGARQLDDHRDAARPGAAPDDGRRARELAGLAQGQGDAAGRRLRRPQPDRRGPGRRRRPRARPLRRARRARRRGRADAPRRRGRVALAARADPGRLDRARGHRGRARADPRPRDRQLDQPRGRPRQGRPRRAARARPRRLPHRADDRRGRHGEDGRSASSRSPSA